MRFEDPEVFRSIAEDLPIGMYITDRSRRIVFWNREAEHITGYASHEVVGRFCHETLLMHCDARGGVLCMGECPVSKAMHNGRPQQSDLYLHHRAGHRVPVHIRTFPIRGGEGNIVGAVETFEEHPSLLLSVRRQSTLAAHGCLDAATGLPNRPIMQSHLRENLNLLREHYLPFGVLVAEVEGMKEFELAHSREALSAILHVLARSIAHLLGPDSLLGRWNEAQLLAIVPDGSPVDLESYCNQVRDLARCSEIQWWGDHLSITVQAGYAVAETGDAEDTTIERAQQSLLSHSAHDRNRRPAGTTQEQANGS